MARTIRLSDYTRPGHTLFHVLPADAGQTLEVSYALLPDGCGSGELLRCSHDRSTGTTAYEIASLVEGDEDGEDGEDGDSTPFEPWNGILPEYDCFEACEDIGVTILD